MLEGCLPQQLDRALENFGMAMGPCRMADLAGLDIGWPTSVAATTPSTRTCRARPSPTRCAERRPLRPEERGRLLPLPSGSREALPDPEVEEIILAQARARGVTRRAIGDEEIVQRCVFALVNEGARILEEGIAQRASDIDIVYLTGYGFPAYRGGPMFYADSIGLHAVLYALRRFAAQPVRRSRRLAAGTTAGAPRLPRQDLQRFSGRETDMSDAVIVATARTPLCKSWRGAFNMTHGATLGAHVVRAALTRARLEPAEAEDIVFGCAYPEGATGLNIARQIALRAELPVTTAGMTVNRFCSSGLQAIAIAAQRVLVDRVPVVIAGGVESISCVQNELNQHMLREAWLKEHKPEIYCRCSPPPRWWPSVTRFPAAARTSTGCAASCAPPRPRRPGALLLKSHPSLSPPVSPTRTAAGSSRAQVTVERDEGIRPDTTLEGVAKIKPAVPGGSVAAGNASQFSDGAAACVVMDSRLAEQRGLEPLGAFRGLRGGRLRAR